MNVDFLYRISAFGNFLDIEPSPDNMVFFVNEFKDYGMYPSVLTEISMDTPINMPQQRQRIGLLSNDNTRRFIISSNRIDYEITPQSSGELNTETIDNYNKAIIFVFSSVFSHYGKSASRLALNYGRRLINLEKTEIISFINKHSNPLPFYSDKALSEWALHFMTKQDIEVGKTTEKLNIITNITKVFSQHENGIQSEGIQIDMDINTVAENDAIRFTGESIEDFIKHSLEINTKILGEIGGN